MDKPELLLKNGETRFGNSWRDRRELIAAGLEALNEAGIMIPVNEVELARTQLAFDDRVGQLFRDTIYSIGVEEKVPIKYIDEQPSFGHKIVSKPVYLYSHKRRHNHQVRLILESEQEWVFGIDMSKAVLAQIVSYPESDEEVKNILELSEVDYIIGSVLLKYWYLVDNAPISEETERIAKFINLVKTIKQLQDTGHIDTKDRYATAQINQICRTVGSFTRPNDRPY